MIELFKLMHNEGKVIFMANKTNSMAHTKWMCKYHIVFTPKYRRKAIYNQYKVSICGIIKQLCAYNVYLRFLETPCISAEIVLKL